MKAAGTDRSRRLAEVFFGVAPCPGVACGRGKEERDLLPRFRRALRTKHLPFAAIIACSLPLEAAAAPNLVSLHAEDSDVWSFERTLRGEASERCARLRVEREAPAGRASLEPMREGRTFWVSVSLHAGLNRVSAVCVLPDGRQQTSNVATLKVRLPDRPRARIRVRTTAGDRIVLDGGSSAGSPSGAQVISTTWRARDGNPETLRRAGGGGIAEGAHAERLVLQTPSRSGEYYVTLEVTDERGVTDQSTAYFVVSDGQARAADPLRERPAWVDGAVVYGTVPFLFGDRGLVSVRDRLDELETLGVDTLWLSPILESPPDDYGYAVTDYFDVRDGYGTTEDLRALVREAHRRGMRVVMDFVPNHTSSAHPYFLDAEARGPRSPYFRFYERNEEGAATHYFGWENLPNLNYDNPEVRRWMIEAFSYWVREMDIDGFRIDAAWGLERRAPDLFRELSLELLRMKPDLLIIPEASARDGYWFENGADAVYDWTDEVGRWAWRRAFGRETVDVAALHDALTNHGKGYPPNALPFRFLDNNDTGIRFAARHSEPVYRVAAALLFTLPGIPSLFTGDEVGAEYEPYQRLDPLSWKPKPARAELISRLIALRRSHAALQTGRFEPQQITGGNGLYAYVRRGDHEELLVLLNFSRDRRVATLHPKAEWSEGSSLFDLLGERDVLVRRRGGDLEIPIPAHGALVLRL